MSARDPHGRRFNCAFDRRAAILQAVDDIRCPHHRGLVRNREHRDLAGQAPDRGHDAGLRFRVQRGGGFVEDQQRRVANQRPGDGDALSLSAGKPRPSLANHRIDALRQCGDEIPRLGAA